MFKRLLILLAFIACILCAFCCIKKKPIPEVVVVNPVHRVLERTGNIGPQQWEVIRRELRRNGIEIVKSQD